jgi:hypothetical protein
VPRTYSHLELEAAVALGCGLGLHEGFDAFVTRHDLQVPSDQWSLCIDAAVSLEHTARCLDVEWGETHDFVAVVNALVEEIVHQQVLNTVDAVHSVLARRGSRCGDSDAGGG